MKTILILFILLLSFHPRLSLSSSNLPAPKSKSIPQLEKKPTLTLEDKQQQQQLDKVKISSKKKTPHLNFKEEVEKLIAGTGTDPKPKPLTLKKNKTFVQQLNKDQIGLSQTDQTDEIKPKKPKIKLSSKPADTNATSKVITKSSNNEEEGEDMDMMPDLPELMERLSISSKAYITAANSGIAQGVRPFVGSKFAQLVAPIASALFLLVPLLLLVSIVKRLESCLSLVGQLLGFMQAYLAIYFGTLAVTALVTGLEPLGFFYASSSSSYTWTQMAQSLAYVVYLVLQLVHLLAVFSNSSASTSTESRHALALAQMLLGLAVGLHYYAAVFHRAVTGEPPRANWHVHGVYAMCFILICACARADRRKKLAYVGGGGVEGTDTDQWKKS